MKELMEVLKEESDRWGYENTLHYLKGFTVLIHLIHDLKEIKFDVSCGYYQYFSANPMGKKIKIKLTDLISKA